MKVLMRQRDLSDEYILFAQQIGADGIDIHNCESVPGCVEQGYPDREGLAAIVQKLRQAGLGLYRVAPCDPLRYLRGEAGGEEDVENLVKTIQVFGALGIPFMSVPIHLINPGHRGGMRHVHRGGYTMHGFEVERMEKSLAADPWQEKVTIDEWWDRCVELYKQLVPVAENYNVRLITHPADPPLPTADASPRRWLGLMEAVPSEHNGLLYCIGTRYESGVDILADIRSFALKGLIFHTHIRNVRGQIPTAGGYEEVAMSDGDMNLFKVLSTLREVGFDGGLQIDHLPNYNADDSHQKIAAAFAVGYVKALLATLNG